MKRHAAAFILVLGATLLFQAWFLGLTPRGIEIGDERLSSPYTEALAHGQSYLPEKPDPAHPLLDTSLFHGRHYIYFGIVPFAAFMVPAYLLTGSAPSPEAAIFLFCALGYLAYGAILLLGIRRCDPRVPLAVSSGAFLLVIVGSGTWPLMGRPAIYEIENAAAYAFLGLSLLSLALHESGEAKSRCSLACTGAFAALTMGCRPNYFPAVAVVAGWVLFRAWGLLQGRPRRALLALGPLIPLFAIGAALAYWNFHRFGNPLDFGLKHTVSEDPAAVRPLSSLSNIPYHLHRYAIGAAHLIRYFPFIQGQKEGPFPLAGWQEVSNQVYGLLLVTPVLLGAVLALLIPGEPGARRLRAYAGVCLAAFLGNFLFLCSVTQSCYRYPADFLGPLAMVAALGWVLAQGRGRKVGLLANGVLFPFLAWSAAAVTCQTFSTAQTTSLFDQRRPADFMAAARPFNHVVYALEGLFHDGPRAVRVTVRLPRDRSGRSEPLVVVGDKGAQDFLYLYYAGAATIQVGYEATGLGGVLSSPVPVDPGQSHVFEVRYGSFLPPDDDPMLKGISPGDLQLLRRMITVLVDGKPAIDAEVDFHLPRGRILIGESPDDDAFGSKFTGTVESVAYPRLAARISPARWDGSAYGAVSMSMALNPMPAGVYDPVLSLGLGRQGAQLLIEHVDTDTIRFVWLTTQGERLSSPAYRWPSHSARKVAISVGSLLPPVTASLWSESESLSQRQDAKRMLRVMVDGTEAWSTPCNAPDVSPDMVAVGKDTLFLIPGVMPQFAGTVSNMGRLPW